MLLILTFISYFSLLSPDSDTNSTFLSKFGEFKNASSITISRDESIFVADIDENIIYKYDINGKLKTKFGGPGFGNDQFNQPVHLDASNGLNLFITDYQNNRIQKYDLNFNYITSISFNNYNLRTDNSTKIYYPFSAAPMSSNEIFVLANAGNYKAFKSDESGNIEYFFGSDIGENRIIKPVKILKGDKLTFYILDLSQNAVLQFDNSGNLVKKIENKSEDTLINFGYFDNNIFLLTKGKIYQFDTSKGQFCHIITYNTADLKKPIDIAILDDKHLFLLTNNYIYKIEFK